MRKVDLIFTVGDTEHRLESSYPPNEDEEAYNSEGHAVARTFNQYPEQETVVYEGFETVEERGE